MLIIIMPGNDSPLLLLIHYFISSVVGCRQFISITWNQELIVY